MEGNLWNQLSTNEIKELWPGYIVEHGRQGKDTVKGSLVARIKQNVLINVGLVVNI